METNEIKIFTGGRNKPQHTDSEKGVHKMKTKNFPLALKTSTSPNCLLRTILTECWGRNGELRQKWKARKCRQPLRSTFYEV